MWPQQSWDAQHLLRRAWCPCATIVTTTMLARASTSRPLAGGSESLAGQSDPAAGGAEILASVSDAEALASRRDVPSYVYYGVNTREAVALRLFGVPRAAALGLARTHGAGRSTDELRGFLASSKPSQWTHALGDVGRSYFDAWRLIEPAT